MKWSYECPKCTQWGTIEWSDREKNFICHNCKESHTPVTPAQQHVAYVDTHPWPNEIENVVVGNKGNKCTVPGCNKNYETLDHRVPYSKGGKTSVSNLWPMCENHNQAKSDSDYATWLSTL